MFAVYYTALKIVRKCSANHLKAGEKTREEETIFDSCAHNQQEYTRQTGTTALCSVQLASEEERAVRRSDLPSRAFFASPDFDQKMFITGVSTTSNPRHPGRGGGGSNFVPTGASNFLFVGGGSLHQTPQSARAKRQWERQPTQVTQIVLLKVGNKRRKQTKRFIDFLWNCFDRVQVPSKSDRFTNTPPRQLTVLPAQNTWQ